MGSIDHPEAIRTTHVPVAAYQVGPYYFLVAVPRGESFDDNNAAWWVSKNSAWLRQESFRTLEEAMRYAARPSAS